MTKGTDKAKFELHCQMIREATGCTASEAKFKAWAEGPDGLKNWLNKSEEKPAD